MTVIISEIITQGEQSHLKHIASANTEANALAVLQGLLQQQDGKQYQINTWIDAQPTYLAVAALPTAYHAGIDAVACVWTPISEHDDQQAAYDACKAFAASGQHHDAFMVVSSDSKQYSRLKSRLLEAIQ